MYHRVYSADISFRRISDDGHYFIVQKKIAKIGDFLVKNGYKGLTQCVFMLYFHKS